MHRSSSTRKRAFLQRACHSRGAWIRRVSGCAGVDAELAELAELVQVVVLGLVGMVLVGLVLHGGGGGHFRGGGGLRLEERDAAGAAGLPCAGGRFRHAVKTGSKEQGKRHERR